jgi:pyruvate/2-oxoglutarate dehydrogenase complex dihydrolipoamide dehydrogenase (E3) component
MALVKSVMPDALIIATGSLPIVPRIAGLESGKVYTATKRWAKAP